MTGEALQIDFQPQPRGIAVVTSAPISEIAASGKYSAFQDLIDGYASSFQKVLVFSPSGEQVVKPVKNHRVSWFSGPGTLSPTNGLWWSVMKNRRVFQDVELVRTFGPRAGIVGKAISRFTKSPHVSSSDDLVENTWRDKTGLRSAPTKLISKLGMLRANVLSATLDWELEYLSDAGYEKDLLLSATGLATDIYTPVGTTDPDRHPVVLWAAPVSDDSIELIEKSAIETQQMIENVQFIVIALGDASDQLKSHVEERGLPISVVSLSDAEPLVDLIERTWACVTVPGRDFPHGLAMLALSAGIPLISVGKLAERHGFTNHLTHVGVDPDDHEGVAYGLQLLRRWSTWALRIGSAGQKLVEERYSTRTVAIKEGEQLARLARGEEFESTTPKEAKVLRTYLSPATGEVPAFWAGDSLAGSKVGDETDPAEDMYSDPGFDLVVAALADISSSVPTAPSEPKPDTGNTVQDAISALFAAKQANAVVPAAEPVDSSADLGQDAITALFAANDPEPEEVTEPADTSSADMGQDAISALFAANDPGPAAVVEPEAPISSDMSQDAISALFAASDADPEVAAEEPVDLSADIGQDAISALFAANDPEPALVAKPQTLISADMGQDAISALFGTDEATTEPAATSDAIETSSYDSVEDDLANTDMPEINMVQLGSGEVEAELSNFDNFDAEDDIDVGLIESILEGKNEDPVA